MVCDPQEDRACRRFLRLTVLTVSLGNCLVVLERYRVATKEMVERSLVLVKVDLLGSCYFLGRALRLDLGLMFCYTLGSQNRSLWRTLSVSCLVCCKYSIVGWTYPGVLTYCIGSGGVLSIPIM